jgi:hypothetical protein
VSRARRFAAAVDGLRLPDGRVIRAGSVAGVDPTAARQRTLAELAAGDTETLSLVSNARCLSEGVNVPAVDGVMFGDPKESPTDIAQAIGRALRPAAGKTQALIILPVTLPGSDGNALFAGSYAGVWSVLRTLRQLDPRMAVELDRLAKVRNPDLPPREGPQDRLPLLHFDLGGTDPADVFGQFLDIDDERQDERWDTSLEVFRAWAAKHGHTAASVDAQQGEFWVGRWAAAQRKAYLAGALSPYQVARLEGVPGWEWTLDRAWWNLDHATVLAAAGRGLHLDNVEMSMTWLRHRAPNGRSKNACTVGRWCARQRRLYRNGDLDENSAKMCEKIPGWTWDADVPERDLRMVDALAEWVEAYRDANVPEDGMWGNLPLGKFVTALRRRSVMGRLSLPLLDDVAVVTPTRWENGALRWHPMETRWDLHLLALEQFRQRTGGLDIPEHWKENFHGWEAQLYAWATRQRHQQRSGELDPARKARLDQVPGWQWERTRKSRVRVGIGSRQHGTRMGYAAGCTCEDCTAANTAYEAQRQAQRAAGLSSTDLVDAAGVRGHLRILDGQVGWRARIAMMTIAGVNKKTVDNVINGAVKRVTPEVFDALKALDADQLRQWIAANPTTVDPVPVEQVLPLIEAMVRRRWSRSWIAREIGMGAGNFSKIGKVPTVHYKTAQAIRALHEALGDRVAPTTWRASAPPLAELLQEVA